MDTNNIILLSQAIGSALVLGVQVYLIGGLQKTIDNLKITVDTQKTAIEAMQAQATGLVTLNEKILSYTTTYGNDLDRHVAIIRSTATLEAQEKTRDTVDSIKQEYEKKIKELEQGTNNQEPISDELKATLQSIYSDLSKIQQNSVVVESTDKEIVIKILDLLKINDERSKLILAGFVVPDTSEGGLDGVKGRAKEYVTALALLEIPRSEIIHRTVRLYPMIDFFYKLALVDATLQELKISNAGVRNYYYPSENDSQSLEQS